jgi:adenylate kinase
MSKENIYLLYGPPGSGKSTLAKDVSQNTGLMYISVGQLTRAEIATGSEVGKALKKCLDDVVEYPVDLISGVIDKSLRQTRTNGGNFLIDGFPKYEEEANQFLLMVDSNNWIVPSIFVVKLPFENSLERVANRRICLSCQSQVTVAVNGDKLCTSCGGELTVRDDDKPENLWRRYNDFVNSIEGIMQQLKVTDASIFALDGTLPKDDILRKITENIKAHNLPE